MPKIRMQDVEREFQDDRECFMHHQVTVPCKKCRVHFCPECSLSTIVPVGREMPAAHFCPKCRNAKYEDDLYREMMMSYYLDDDWRQI